MGDRASRAEDDPHAERVRVLWAIKGLGPGGAERLLVHHARAADQTRFDLRAVYLVPEKAHLVPELEAAGVAVTCLGPAAGADLRWLVRLRRHLVEQPVDIVHAHAPLLAAAARLVVRTLPRAVRPAVLSTEHNRWPRHRLPTRLANRCTLRLEDAHLAVSEDVRASMPRRHRAAVQVLHHGIPLDAVRATADRAGVRAELGHGDDDVVLCCVANLRREKAHDDLLRAMALAVERAPRLRLVLVGQGPLHDEVAARCGELGLGARVQMLGYRVDATRLLSGADALVLSSRHEGLPVALMEARALGVPIVATAVGGVPEAVADGVDGLLVPPASPERLADAMVRFATDPRLRAALAHGAAAQADRFDVRTAVAAIERIYEGLVASPRARSRRS